MAELPREYADYLKALAEGRQSWSGWPRWFASRAGPLASLVGRDLMRRLKQDARAALPTLLAEFGVPCTPSAPAAPQVPAGSRPLPDDWSLAICEEPTGSLETLRRLRAALGLSVAALPGLRRQLPGVYRRGRRDDLRPLLAALEQQGLCAALFPSWELEDAPADGPDPIRDEEYEVYTAVGHTDLLRFELPGLTFCDLVGDAACSREAIAERLHGLCKYRCLKHPEILADYERQNAEGGRLRKRFRTRGGYQLLSERRRKEPCREGGVVHLTRVGLGRSGTLALVGFSYYGGPLCGFGCYLLFAKGGEGWHVLDRSSTWVS